VNVVLTGAAMGASLAVIVAAINAMKPSKTPQESDAAPL
jgi:hypothetical protein